ncbi:MAG: AI-2E family transporter [Armatimonadota bacterium]
MYSEQSRQPVTAWFLSWLRPVVIILAVFLLLIIGYRIFQEYLSIPVTIILLAIILTYLLRPLVERMVVFSKEKYLHLSRVAAVLLLYAAFGWAIYAFGAVTVTTLSQDAENLKGTWQIARQEIPKTFNNVVTWYKATVPTSVQLKISASLQTEMQRFLPQAMSKVFGVAQVALEWVGLLIELIFVPLVAFYLLTDGKKVREQVMGFVPARFRERLVYYATGMDGILRRYVIGQLILCAIAWIAVTVAMLALGVKGALLLGVIAGVSRAIPVIGPVVGGIPVLAAVFVTIKGEQDGLPMSVFWWVLAGFTLLHLFESKVLMPRILGEKLGIHPVIVIISLLLGYELMGLLGMFIAPPAVAMVRYILQERSKEAEPSESESEELVAAVPEAAT